MTFAATPCMQSPPKRDRTFVGLERELREKTTARQLEMHADTTQAQIPDFKATQKKFSYRKSLMYRTTTVRHKFKDETLAVSLRPMHSGGEDTGPKRDGPCVLAGGLKGMMLRAMNLHTYLDGIGPFTYLGLWALRSSHSTATLSPGGTRGLYGLRLMHRPNIFLSRSGPRAGRALLFVLTRS